MKKSIHTHIHYECNKETEQVLGMGTKKTTLKLRW